MNKAQLKKKNPIFNPDNVLCTSFVLLLVIIITITPINNSIITPLKELIKDLELTDLVFSKLRTEQKADTNIVLVNIGNLDREGIAQEIKIINHFQPKVIGIDAIFKERRSDETDMQLTEALSQVKTLVMVSKPINYNSKTSKFESEVRSHDMFVSNSSSASSTLITNAQGQDDIKISRAFNALFPIKGRETLLPFGVKLAESFDVNAISKFASRDNEVEVINFRGNYGGKFAALDVKDVLDTNFVPELIKGKIVIFGFLGSYLGEPSWEDKFFTPMNDKYAGRANPDMFGAVIHANIASMIITQDYINETPQFANLVLALIICFANVALFSWIHDNKQHLYYILIRFIQVIEVFLLLGLALVAFHLYSLKINLTTTIISTLMVGDMLKVYYYLIKQPINSIKLKFLYSKINY